jgi:hypothetical protein
MSKTDKTPIEVKIDTLLHDLQELYEGIGDLGSSVTVQNLINVNLKALDTYSLGKYAEHKCHFVGCVNLTTNEHHCNLCVCQVCITRKYSDVSTFTDGFCHGCSYSRD